MHKTHMSNINQTNHRTPFCRVGLVAPFLAVLCLTSAVSGKDQVPFHGTFEGVDRAFIEPCTTTVEHSGEGQATHLGLFTLTATLVAADTCSTFPILPFEADEVTLTAANGDQLFGTAVGASTLIDFTDPTQIRIVEEATFTVTGGTGRFAHATGTIQWILVAEVYAATALPDDSLLIPTFATLEGTLSSVGANTK